jgi:hypothetical protein
MIKILLHFMACYIIADVVYTFLPRKIGADAYWQPIIPRLIAVATSCLAGVGKEFYDLWQGESFSAGDLTVDFSGALAWLFLLLIAEVIYKRNNG